MTKESLLRLKDIRPAPECRRSKDGKGWVGNFQAMASPCEILLDGDIHADQCDYLVGLAAHEAWRIEEKFSRYRSDNILFKINQSNGVPVELDDETAQLINYAYQCYELSAGLFDISSGPLRRVWQFNGSEQVLDKKLLESTLALVGLGKCLWQQPYLTLVKGAEIDVGGIGKEYAVDRALQVLKNKTPEGLSYLINFGGDLVCSGPRQNGSPWVVGVESVAEHSPLQQRQEPIQLHQGAIATSGDTHRFLMFGGKKLSHVLNPITGYPVADAPRSVTVMAPSCTLAGMLATFAMLEGSEAESFLAQQNVKYWIQRDS